MGSKKKLDHGAMRKYFAEGHTAKETAEKFGTSKDYAGEICKGIRSGNQYTNGLFDRVANAKRYIMERTPTFEYVGNYTGIDGYVDLKCKICGTIDRKSFVTVRKGTATCKECRRREREKQKEQKEQKEKAEKETKEEKRKLKKYKTVFKKQPRQMDIKICPICGSLFYNGKNYCSEKCALQNRWQMKDGYRHKFPLEELYKRDGGICYICGGLCDWNDYIIKNGVKIYGNNYPSRDHIIPKSKGGLNSWDNIKLAHRLCNSRKSDSPLYKKMA